MKVGCPVCDARVEYDPDEVGAAVCAGCSYEFFPGAILEAEDLEELRQDYRPKPLAGGRYLGPKAFEYVFDEVGVAATMFGMGSIDQVRGTTTAAKAVLGATT